MASESRKNFTGERFIPDIKDKKLALEHYQRYYSIKNMVKDKIVVDAACGEGYGSEILSENAKSVLGIDIDIETIENAKNRYKGRNILFRQGDVTQLPIETNSIDVFISFETIEHISDEYQIKFLQEIDRVLKIDGILIMSTPNKEIYSDLFHYKNKFHIKEFYKNEFIEFLKLRFENVQLYNQFFEVASIIDSSTKKQNKVFYNNNDYFYDGKYFIAIASNKDIPEYNITSVFMDSEKEYEVKINRILELQSEVEIKNKHIIRLDDEIMGNRVRIATLQEEECGKNNDIEKLNDDIMKLNNNKEQLNVDNRKLNNDIEQLNIEIEQLNVDNRKLCDDILKLKINKDKEINKITALLNERLSEINILSKTINDRDYIINQKNARIFDLEHRCIRVPKMVIRTAKKILTIPRRIYEFVFPLDSNRRKIISSIKNKVLHPLNTIRRKKRYKVQSVIAKVKYEDITFFNPDNPIVSIIIPVYNQINYTYQCLKSILKETYDISYEIIIADDVSTDKTKDIKNFVHGINICRNKENLGFLKNCNNAANKAKGKYILFLNNDTQVLDKWLSTLVSIMEKDCKVGLVGSKLLFSDGLLQEAGGIIWKDASGWNYGRGQEPDKSEYNYMKEVDYVSGAAMMIRSVLWNEIGGFDELFVPAYCEDSDIAFQVRQRGYKVVYQPLSKVIHFEGISNGTDLNNGIKQYQMENMKKFHLKWEKELENQFTNGENVFLARERGKNKKVILVIDHYVPTYDRDAGSKTTYQYLKMFVSKGFIVKFIGDNYCAMEPYTTTLQQMGIEVLNGTWYAAHIQEWIRENQIYIDFVYLNRPHITEKYIDFLKRETNIKLIYYGHDLHYLRIKREYELTKEKKYLIESQEWKQRELDIMKKVDMSYYPSYIEREEINRIDPTVPVKAITAYVYEKFKNNISFDFSGREGILFVGGFGHSPNVDAVLWFVNTIYPLVIQRLQIPLYIVGSNAPVEIKQLDGNGIIVKGFVTDEELEELYSSCKLAVVPLRYGAGVKGKVIEAIYNAIPVITTACGAEGIENCDELLVIEDDTEKFAEKIVELYQNNKKLSEISRKTQYYIKEYFSVDVAWKIVEKDFQ